MERIEVTVLATIYRNSENGYSVLSVREGSRERTVVGTLPRFAPGEQAAFTGEWIEHPTYGRQLKASACEPLKPTTLLGIERYLGSGLIKGVGPRLARQIVERFGEETLTVISEHPEQLKAVRGLGGKKWKQIAEAYHEQNDQREAMVFLQSYGVPPALSVRISRLYGAETPAVIRQNPYRLCEDIEGVGFLTADRIGTAIGIPQDAASRVQAALKYVLLDAAVSMGHVYLPKEEFLLRAGQLLHLPGDVIEHALMELTVSRQLFLQSAPEGERVWLPSYDRAERETAQRLVELLNAAEGTGAENGEAAVDRFEKRTDITFSQRQRDAILDALRWGVLVITGGPGTGKTTIINCILSLLEGEGEILLCAPTGRAAKRMTEATGRESKTIHRLLEYSGETGGFTRDQDNPLEAGCVIVDEASMIDLMLMRSLLRAIRPGTRLIIVGDADQLPSVGAGNVLGDILASGIVPAARLTDIFRQSAQSRIVINAHRINHGEMPLLNEKGTDSFLERAENPIQAAERCVALSAKRLPGYLGLKPEERMRAIQVLAPARKGDCGVIRLNQLLQDALNPREERKPFLTWGDTEFRLGDKVMQTVNNYELEWKRKIGRGWENGSGAFNGDVGYVTEVDQEGGSVSILFEDGRLAEYTSKMLDDIELAYCLSVHKSQGSEFRAVILPVVAGPRLLLTRNLFYTALTRARELVVLVGREEVIRQMVENDYILHRYTALTERLQAAHALLLGGGDADG